MKRQPAAHDDPYRARKVAVRERVRLPAASFRRPRGLVALCLAILALLPVLSPARSAAAAVDTSPILAAWSAAEADFAAQCEALAKIGEQQQLIEAAKRVREWSAAKHPDWLYVAKLPKTVEPPVPADATPAAAGFETKFRELRSAQAEVLWKLAKSAADAKAASLANLLLLESLRQAPDHVERRALVGQSRYQNQWVSAWEQKEINAGHVWDDRFGWLRSSHLESYEAGKRSVQVKSPSGRLLPAKWVTAEEEATLRSTIANGWEIETEHYRVRTNHSQREGVRLAVELEALYFVWQQVYLRFWMSSEDQQKLLAKPRRAASSERHEVVYFRSRDEYVSTLRGAATGDISISTGIYFSEQGKAYFFAGSEHDHITLLHEATHQLFSESNPRIKALGRRSGFWENRPANFWIIEGIACYMETLREERGYYVLGGAATDRFQAARYRALELDWYLPFAKLTSYGMLDLLRDKEIAAIYSQATGVSTFLMHAEQGRYRDSTIDYLLDIYQGHDRPNSLEKLTGRSFAELDAAYLEYLKASPRLIDDGQTGK